MLHLAYDGSVSSDWVLRYAVRLAVHTPERRLRLVYVEEDDPSGIRLDERIAHARAECNAASVDLDLAMARGTSSEVPGRILEIVPPGPDSILLCGTRRRQRNLSYLAGTVAEKLLAARRSHVLALHVVQPGLLGLPLNFLLPVIEAGQETAALPVLRLFAPDIDRVHVLAMKQLGRLRFHHLTSEYAEALLAASHRRAERTAESLRYALPMAKAHLDTAAVVSDDVTKEIIIHANKLHARLIFLFDAEHRLPRRLFYGDPLEQILRNAPCDVAIHRGPE